MANKSTELVFILDRSGSMSGLESDTIGGFNALINKQKAEEGTCLVSTVLFSNDSEVIHDRLPLDKIPQMTGKDYEVGGCTALIDAIGGAIRHVERVHRYIRPEDVPEQTIFIIITDGMENASHEFSSDEVKKLIEQKKELGWNFNFIAANIDAVETAKHFGMSAEDAVDYLADGEGTGIVYDAVCMNITHQRGGHARSANWSKAIKENTASRKK